MSHPDQQQNPMIAELQGIIVFQAAQLAQLNRQVLAYQEALGQTKAVLEHSERLSKQANERADSLLKDLEACRFMSAFDSVDEMVRRAHAAYNAAPKAVPAPEPEIIPA